MRKEKTDGLVYHVLLLSEETHFTQHVVSSPVVLSLFDSNLFPLCSLNLFVSEPKMIRQAMHACVRLCVRTN